MINIAEVAGSMLDITSTPAQLTTEPKYRLSQSLIKQLTDPWHCPVKFWEYEIAKLYVRDASEAMTAGNLFEYLVLGSLTREGKVPEMEQLKKGKGQSAAEKRIRLQASRFADIMAENEIQLIKNNVPIYYRYNEELMIDGIIDAQVLWKGKPAILDTKLTSDIHSTFGHYGFGNWMMFDKIQAHMYHYIEKCNWGMELPFIYAIFDYKSNPEHKIEIEHPSQMDIMMLNQRIQAALTTLKSYYAGNIQHKPTYDTCKGCKVDCNLKVTTKPERRT